MKFLKYVKWLLLSSTIWSSWCQKCPNKSCSKCLVNSSKTSRTLSKCRASTRALSSASTCLSRRSRPTYYLTLRSTLKINPGESVTSLPIESWILLRAWGLSRPENTSFLTTAPSCKTLRARWEPLLLADFLIFADCSTGPVSSLRSCLVWRNFKPILSNTWGAPSPRTFSLFAQLSRSRLLTSIFFLCSLHSWGMRAQMFALTFLRDSRTWIRWLGLRISPSLSSQLSQNFLKIKTGALSCQLLSNSLSSPSSSGRFSLSKSWTLSA